MACPHTCGCDLTMGRGAGLLNEGSVFGCPVSCSIRKARQACDLQGSTIDPDPSDEVVQAYISAVFREMKNHLYVQSSYLPIALNEGCAFLRSDEALLTWSIGDISLCNASDLMTISAYGYRSAGAVCPGSCPQKGPTCS